MSGGKNHVTKRLAGDWLENKNKSIETCVERLSKNPGYIMDICISKSFSNLPLAGNVFKITGNAGHLC